MYNKYMFIFLLAFLFVFQTNAFSQNAEEIIRQEKFFYDSLKEKNMKVLPTLLREDFHGAFAGGYIDKKSEVENFSNAVLEDYKFSNVLVKFPTKNVGIIIYKAFIKGSYKQLDITGNSYHTSTWVRKNKKWQMIMHMEVPVKEANMTNEFKGIATVSYKVSDIAKAKEWYTKAFGIAPYFDEPFYVGFNINGFELGLLPEEAEKSVKGNASIAYWAVVDIEKTYKHFIDSGASEVEKPNDVGGNIKVATIKDPWGNQVGLIFNPNFKK